MNDTLPIEKNCQHHLHIRATLTCFFWSWRKFSHPLRRLNFSFNIVAVHRSVITCYDIFQKVFISIRTIKQLLTDSDTVLSLCICQQTRHKFCGNTAHLQFVGQNKVARTYMNIINNTVWCLTGTPCLTIFKIWSVKKCSEWYPFECYEWCLAQE